jgi:carbamoyl-phosphate synthase small subunit
VRGVLCLEDGYYLEGELANGLSGLSSTVGRAAGEVIFTTGMTGYEDDLTDPSYAGQILVFAFPMLGNYGVPLRDNQASRVYARGVVVRDLWKGPVEDDRQSLSEFLAQGGCPVLTGVDTRRLALHLRDHGIKKGVIAPVPESGLTPDLVDSLVTEASSLDIKGLVEGVAAREVRRIGPLQSEGDNPHKGRNSQGQGLGVIVDFGADGNVEESLLGLGFELVFVPPTTPTEDILAMSPDFVIFSNGPGDPDDNEAAIEAAREILGKVPVYGVGLGHQVMARAAGANVIRLKHGHHGTNYPVKELATGKMLTTLQSHTYTVDPDNLPSSVVVTHININDGSIEGLRYKDPRTGDDLLAASVQFCPEGPFLLDALLQPKPAEQAKGATHNA